MKTAWTDNSHYLFVTSCTIVNRIYEWNKINVDWASTGIDL